MSERICGLCCSKIENFNVTKGKMEILKDINIHFHCGDLTAIIGPNGAGKTTLLKAVLGEIEHTGTLTFLNLAGQNHENPIIGYVPQQLNFDLATPMSVADLFASCISKRPVWLGHSKKTITEIEETLDKVNMGYAIDRKIGALSGGELQRVLLALALSPVPNILLLDEPISGIDQAGTEMFYKIISQLRKDYDMAIVLVSHDLQLLAKYADRVILLNQSIACEGTPDYVFSHNKTKELMGTFWIGD
ncbi:MAG TPA: metal ABC transporter ATP-binding protein [Epulopiscium sp.]|nr:metal ABC transporter ATP-binding protein [Candidatus Epulonipiscium sp.]